MAMYFSMYWHFPMMVILIMIISGIIGFRFPRFPFFIVLIGSGLIGYVYAIMVYLEEISVVLVAYNVFAALVPIVLVKWAYYLRQKADEMEMQIRNG